MVAFRDGRRSTPKDQAAYEAKLNTLAATIAAAAPDVLAVHLKSKLLTFPDGRFNPTDEDERARFAAYALNRRIAEAATAREAATAILNGHGQDRPLVVLGDLNDTDQAATTQLLYGPPGSRYGTGGFSHPDHGDGQRLWNLAPQIPPGHRYSRIFEGQRELIDHILISHALLLTRLQSVDTRPNEVVDHRQPRHPPRCAGLRPRTHQSPVHPDPGRNDTPRTATARRSIRGARPPATSRCVDRR